MLTQATKDFLVQSARVHQEQDNFVRGTYGETEKGAFRGCSVGCTLHDCRKAKIVKTNGNGNHAAFEQIGYPEWLARLQDALFEWMPEDDAKAFTLRLYESLPVGVDFAPLKHKFLAHLLREETHFDRKAFPLVDAAIQECIALHDKAAEGTEEVVEAAWSAAWSAKSAAESAAWSAAWSAWSAAQSAAESAWSAAKSAAFLRLANSLIAILTESQQVSA